MEAFYDGPREGVADYAGAPHRYESEWNELDDEYGPCFRLTPLDPEVFELALEDWQIWMRWLAAFEAGDTTSETHPALPADRPRQEELQAALASGFASNQARAFRARAEFRWGSGGVRPGDCSKLEVRWHAA